MLALKLAGGCLLALAGWFGGAAVCTRASTHRAALGQTVALLKTLEEEIAFRRTNLNALFAQLAQRGAYPLLGVAPSTEQACFHAMVPPQSFGKEECAVFCACFARLGYTGAQQECERLARYRKQFEGFYRQAQKDEQSALAIDRKIGLALGSMVALMLL